MAHEAVGLDGRSHPLGATPIGNGVNFSIYAKGCDRVHLLLFDDVSDPQPARVLTLDPGRHRTYHYWHVYVPGTGPGQVYGWRAEGPFDPARGLRFDVEKVLLDPYGRAVAWPRERSRLAAASRGDNAATSLKSVVADTAAYDWEDDARPARPPARSVLYEMHVGAFTRHPNSGVPVERRGTYAGLVDKIPYLVDLGVTAVELLPVFAFDEQDAAPGRQNVWGYSPVSFFAPHPAYCSRREPLAALDEFRDMVKALHRAGLEVILDVVYNHTAEGSERGPTLAYRGLANDTYYILEGGGKTCANYSGCGNTLNANHPIVRRLILDSLRYWVEEMHVDGFRFDLASILARDECGRPMPSPPVLWDIESDPVLCNVKLIAEAWDAAGLYQVGSFVGDSWQEWNGRFRDDLRAFVKGDAGVAPAAAARLLGSPDVFGHEAREPEQSINFITCHDGFTLNDVVSYDRKHNEANGEDNRDGADDNRSWNCGVEGPTGDPAVEALRDRQVRNFLALLLVGVGTPMLLMGDEVRRTQHGNNNAYCLDDERAWFDWSQVERHAALRRFVRTLVRFRTARPLDDDRGLLTLDELLGRHAVTWHGIGLRAPDWGYDSRTLAYTTPWLGGAYALHVIANAYWDTLRFEIPDPPAGALAWRRVVDTTQPSPDDACEWVHAPILDGRTYPAGPRSVVILGTLLPGRNERP
jgi:glycogen operon protein